MNAGNILYLVKEARKNKKDIGIININDEKIKLDSSERFEIVDSKTILYGDSIMFNVDYIYMIKIIY